MTETYRYLSSFIQKQDAQKEMKSEQFGIFMSDDPYLFQIF